MASTSAIARSGLLVASLSVDVSANNVANVLTEEFVPSRVAPREVEGGGVSADVEPLDGPAKAAVDPLAEVRADRALLAPDRVDLVQEMVNQSRGAAVYRANLETLRTSEEMDATLVGMVGSRSTPG